MNKALDEISNNLPAEMQKEIQTQLAELQSSTDNNGSTRIKLKRGRFILPDDTSIEGKLEAVIVSHVSVNQLYKGAYDAEDPQPPVCYAVGKDPNKLIPTNDSPDQQASACDKCPSNQWGSSGKGKACKNTRLLAILTPDDPTKIYTISVSPTALKAFDSYINKLVNKRVLPVMVVTNIAFDQKCDYLKLAFSLARSNENFKLFHKQKGAAEALLLTIPNFQGEK